MGNVFYTADLHIGHKFVAETRGVEVELHDDWLAEEWDYTVRKDDQVFILGDISINGGQHALDWIKTRPGIKHLIAGNHDPVGPWDRRSTRLLPKWLEVFQTIQPYLRRKLDGQNFLLSHFPYWPHDRGEPRYEQYRLPDLGLPLLHGHTHSKKPFEFPNSLNVGWDAWEQLVGQNTILEWLKS